MVQFSVFCFQTGTGEDVPPTDAGKLSGFFSGRRAAVRFRRLPRAHAGRSQSDDEAKADLNFFPPSKYPRPSILHSEKPRRMTADQPTIDWRAARRSPPNSGGRSREEPRSGCVVSASNGDSSHFCINESKRHHRPLSHI